MTDLPNPGADPAANPATPDGETPAPAGDPDLAALAALVQRNTSPDPDAPAPSEESDTVAADTSPISEDAVDAVPVVPVAAAMTDDQPRPRRRRRTLAL